MCSLVEKKKKKKKKNTNSYAEGTSALLSAWRTGEGTHLIDLRTTSNAVTDR